MLGTVNGKRGIPVPGIYGFSHGNWDVTWNSISDLRFPMYGVTWSQNCCVPFSLGFTQRQ